MRDFIHRPISDRRLIFEQAEVRLGLPARNIEKDFWVCWMLSQLFSLPGFGSSLTFKGGTSLSKAWRFIERFSEDIDIVFDRKFLGFDGDNDPESANSRKQRQNGLKALKEQCSRCIMEEMSPVLEDVLKASLPGSEAWSLVRDEADADGQTLLFYYPRCWSDGVLNYVAPAVKIEMGARSDDWPATEVKIMPYVAEIFPQLFTDASCMVRVLSAERTFWEKATLLHEETYRPIEKPRGRPLARHYYDIWCLINAGVASRAMKDDALFLRVVEHREIFFRWTWVDYTTMRRGALRVAPLPEQVEAWRSDYEAMRTEMFFRAPPKFDAILQVVRRFEEEFNRM